MKVNSISGITCEVDDLSRTAEFYEALGFRRGKDESDRLTFYVNWFFVTFISREDENDAELKGGREPAKKGAGLNLYIKVDDVDDFYSGVVSNGMKPVGEPQQGHNRSREFVLRDPDGYTLVFFEKK